MCTFANPKEVQKPKALICTRKQNREGFSLMSRNKSNGENGEKSPEGWRYPEQPLSKGPFAIFGNNLAIVRHFCFLLRHCQRVHFWTYPRILTVLVKWHHPANGLLDGILTSIKRTRINSTTDSMKRYSAIWPIPGRSQSKPWSVYFTFDNSHRKLALVKRTQDFVINLQPHPQGNSRYVNEWRRRGTERDVTSEKTGNDWELVWFYNHGKQEDSCYN